MKRPLPPPKKIITYSYSLYKISRVDILLEEINVLCETVCGNCRCTIFLLPETVYKHYGSLQK
jgi:hypothetical protein